MKKYVLAGLLCVNLLLTNVSSFSMNSDIKVVVNNTQLKLEVPPQIQNGRTLVPLRAIFEALGAIVNWDGKTGTITGKKENTTVILKLNTKEAKVNDKMVQLESPAVSVNGRTLVPVRFISESLGMNVKWDSVNRTVRVDKIIKPTTTTTIQPETITKTQDGLENFLPKYVKFSNINKPVVSIKRIKEGNIEFTQPLNVKELYMYTESASYNVDFIDLDGNTYKLIFPSIEASKLQKTNYWIGTYSHHRTKLDLKNIVKVKITVNEFFKTAEATIDYSEITDLIFALEINGIK